VIVSYLSSFTVASVTQKMVFRIRCLCCGESKLCRGDITGTLRLEKTLYRIEQDVDRVAELSGDILPLTIQMVIMGVMVLVTMGILNWHLTLVIVPLLPVFYVLQRRFASRLKRRQTASRTSRARWRFLQEHLAGMLQFQLLNRTGTQGRSLLAAAEGANSDQAASGRNVFWWASVSVIVLAWADPWLRGYEVTRRHFGPLAGSWLFYGYVFRLFAPVSIAIDLQSRLQRVGASTVAFSKLPTAIHKLQKTSACTATVRHQARIGILFRCGFATTKTGRFCGI